MRRACRVALQLRLSSTSTASVAGPSRSKVDQQQQQQRSTVSIAMTADDEKLIQRGEFYGVAALNEKKWDSKSPELALTRTYDHLNRNFRVSAEAVMNDLVLKLENDDAALLSLLRRAPDRWIPMAVRCCGRALSSIPLSSRRVVASRLWKQIDEKKLSVSIESINALLRVNLDNDEEWNPWQMLKEIEEKRGLVPDQETFYLLLEKFSLAGDIEECSKMIDEMVRHGFSSDAISHSNLVYANALKGHNHTVNSLLEQAVSKFGTEGERVSLGAACVGTSARGDIQRLRELLRRSVDENLRLWLSNENLFEIIWNLSEQGVKANNNETMIVEILNRTQHPTGFFRFLYREIERHISASNFRTATVLLEETNRVKDSLKNQERTVFAEQMVARMCRAMVKSRMDGREMMRIANRMETSLRLRSRFIHDELMMSALTLKDFDSDERFSAFTSLLPAVDPTRERPHIILPLIAFTPNVEDRLKLIFRATALGYSNLEMLNTYTLEKLVFQPMYNRQRWIRKQNQRPGVGDSALDKMTSILNSFGLSKGAVWRMMNDWRKTRRSRETDESSLEVRERPYSEELRSWLRSSFNSSFESGTPPTVQLTKKELAKAIGNKNSSDILSLLTTRGWPQEVDLAFIAPKILDLLIENESSENIMKWLTQLSREVANRQGREGKDQIKSPLNSSHMLRVIRHRLGESRLSAAEVIEMAYELKRLFPHVCINEECIKDVVPDTKRLLMECFPYKIESPSKPELKTEDLDEFIDVIRTLIKLQMAFLSPHSEVLTPFCIQRMVIIFGWDEAMILWQRFVSTFQLGNGIAVLLSEAVRPHTEEDLMKQRVQFVKHKAKAALSTSRIHAICAAVMTNTGSVYSPGLMEEEVVEYFKEHGSTITAFDCMAAYRLVNGARHPQVERYFIRNFPSLCLAYTQLAQDKGEAKNMLHTAVRFCEAKRLGPMVLEMRDIFAKYGVKTDAEDERRIERTMEEHNRSVHQWIYSPDSFIQVEFGQEFLTKDEWKKFVKPNEENVEESSERL